MSLGTVYAAAFGWTCLWLGTSSSGLASHKAVSLLSLSDDLSFDESRY